MVKRLMPVLLLLAAVPFLIAENSISVDMELYNTVIRTRDLSADPYWAYGIAGKSALSFKSAGSGNVKADLAVDINYPDNSGIPVIILQKAYVKAKFPSFRLTLGKTRLGWGDGFIFNSGDVVFGSISPYVNLTGSELRTETAWLTSVNYPLGRFSFIEALVRAPEMSGSGLGKIQDSGAGLRLYTKAGGIKIETGYFFDGAELLIDTVSVDGLHHPYVGLQGNIGPDWFVNSSASLPGRDKDKLQIIVENTFNISFGLFHMMELGYDSSLALRLESVILPFLNWQEEDGIAGSYAMLIYPDISLGLGQTVSLSLRSIISPVDLSAQFTTGFSWNVFEGFNLLTYLSVNAGDGNDTFSWKKIYWDPGIDTMDGISLMAGIKYIY